MVSHACTLVSIIGFFGGSHKLSLGIGSVGELTSCLLGEFGGKIILSLHLQILFKESANYYLAFSYFGCDPVIVIQSGWQYLKQVLKECLASCLKKVHEERRVVYHLLFSALQL